MFQRNIQNVVVRIGSIASKNKYTSGKGTKSMDSRRCNRREKVSWSSTPIGGQNDNRLRP